MSKGDFRKVPQSILFMGQIGCIDPWYYVKDNQSTWWKYVDKRNGVPARERIGRRFIFSW